MQFINETDERVSGAFEFRLEAPTDKFKTVVTPATDETPECTGVLVVLSPEEVLEQFTPVMDKAREFLANESEEEMTERHARYADAAGDAVTPESLEGDKPDGEGEKPDPEKADGEGAAADPKAPAAEPES